MRSIIQVVLLTLTCSTLLAHGVEYQELHWGVGILITYDNQDPMTFADVEIFRPGESEIEFQAGMTDENGVFMFKPDTTGSWTIKVSDGLGHGQVIQFPVDEVSLNTPETPGPSRFQRIVSGLGYILFIFSVWYFYIQRKRNRHAYS
ncbi:MAG: hypothetical protein K9N29_09970 [Candidatus Marinimicrobia bacterium]|nr:hypothetical protein [Candidatus Neomarinimicrobiota bacterium]